MKYIKSNEETCVLMVVPCIGVVEVNSIFTCWYLSLHWFWVSSTCLYALAGTLVCQKRSLENCKPASREEILWGFKGFQVLWFLGKIVGDVDPWMWGLKLFSWSDSLFSLWTWSFWLLPTKLVLESRRALFTGSAQGEVLFFERMLWYNMKEWNEVLLLGLCRKE